MNPFYPSHNFFLENHKIIRRKRNIIRRKGIYIGFWPGLKPGINIIFFLQIQLKFFFLFFLFFTMNVNRHIQKDSTSTTNFIVNYLSFSSAFIFIKIYRIFQEHFGIDNFYFWQNLKDLAEKQ